jgi:hypothetical protein
MIDIIRQYSSGEREHQATCNECGMTIEVITNLAEIESVNEYIEEYYFWYANGDVHYCMVCIGKRGVK